MLIFVIFLGGWYIVSRDWEVNDRAIKVHLGNISYTERCISCHKDIGNVSDNHTREMGCVICHRGNPEILEKQCKSVIKKPAYLEDAVKGCGKCHKEEVEMVLSSLMATQRGFVNAIRYHWGETKTLREDFKVYKGIKKDSSAIEHYKKFCASCHINKEADFKKSDEISNRGGGCLDCHIEKDKHHIKFTINVSDEHCLKCHNRSIRTGLAYYGIFESIGYGVPYSKGKPSNNRLSSHRFFYRIEDDIHHQVGMECIDCHTIYGIMGDKRKHYHLEEAVVITCDDCHKLPKKTEDKISSPITEKLLRLRPYIPPISSKSKVVIGKNGMELYNVRYENGKIVVYKKNSNKRWIPPLIDFSLPHKQKIHSRLSCNACHTKWAYQCYGCHIKKDYRRKQRDKLSGIESYGRFSEMKSFYRFSSPPLGIGYDNKVWVMMPGCEVIRKSIYQNGRVSTNDIHLDFVAISQHTIRKDVVSCIKCHLEPKKLGYGYTFFSDKEKGFKNILRAIKEPIWDNMLMADKFGRANERAFSSNEIKKIFFAGYCAICHNRYDDKIYMDFEKSKERFLSGGLSCIGAKIYEGKKNSF